MAKVYENPAHGHSFWRDALAWGPSITRQVLPRVAVFALYATAVALLHRVLVWAPIAVSHVQYTAGFLVLLLVLRTNAGYERWWEARKLWGGIVNQSRNLVIKGLAYGPDDLEFRAKLVAWAQAFPHACRLSLRGEREAEALVRVLGERDAGAVLAADHMPGFVARRIAEILHGAKSSSAMDGFALLAVDRELAQLIDHIGACERILKTPLPRVHSIKLRRFILLYMLGLPFALGSSSVGLTALATGLIAYPLFAIDRIGQELENPFSRLSQSHLPLDTICVTIEKNLAEALDERR